MFKKDKFLPSLQGNVTAQSKFDKTMDYSMTWHAKNTKVLNCIVSRINILMMHFESFFGITAKTCMRIFLKSQFSIVIFTMFLDAFTTAKSWLIFLSTMRLKIKDFFAVVARNKKSISTTRIGMQRSFSRTSTFRRTKSRRMLSIGPSFISFIAKNTNFFNLWSSIFRRTSSALHTTKLFLTGFKGVIAFKTSSHKSSLINRYST